MQTAVAERAGARSAFVTMYLSIFFYSFYVALPQYADSSFLKLFIPESHVGTVFTVAAFISLIFVINVPRLLRRTGGRRLIVALGVMETLALLGLAFFTNIWIVLFCFLVYRLGTTLLFISLDTLLEGFSDDSTTGAIRGTFLTIINVAILFAPFVAGLVLTDNDFWKIYLMAAMVVLPLILLIGTRLRGFQDPPYHRPPLLVTLKKVAASPNIRGVMVTDASLFFFYVWMIIYFPIYLNTAFAIPYHTIIGIIIPIGLIPFVFLQFIVGKIADTRLGEKEFLTAGLIIMGLSTIALAFITSSSIWIWGAALFMTRVGASLVEVMSETYFFKQITGEDADIIAVFRMIRQTMYILAPLLATLLLSTFHMPEKYLFVILGVWALCAIYFSLRLEDTA